MERTPEPELMDDEEQARAYAEADFAAPHDLFVELFRSRFPALRPRSILDLGCGPGDPSRRLARAYARCRVLGIDAAAAMLEEGRKANAREGMADRVELRLGYLPDLDLAGETYDAIVSNSLLHHLSDPAALWTTVARLANAETAVFVMDLLRPPSVAATSALVEEYAAGEPEVLRRDFENSLHAAYRPDEIRAQLAAANLDDLTVEIASDRHLIVYGGGASSMEET